MEWGGRQDKCTHPPVSQAMGVEECLSFLRACFSRLSDEPDPYDLMRPFPAEPMRMWPISTRVNKLENDDPSILEQIELSAA
jgi:hypothetical protein